MAKISKTRLKPTKASKQRIKADNGMKSYIMTRICQTMEDAINDLPAEKSAFYMASLKYCG